MKEGQKVSQLKARTPERKVTSGLPGTGLGAGAGGAGLVFLLGMASSEEPEAGPRDMGKGQAERSPTGKQEDS